MSTLLIKFKDDSEMIWHLSALQSLIVMIYMIDMIMEICTPLKKNQELFYEDKETL